MTEQDTQELLKELVELTRQNQRWLRVIARDNVESAISSAFSEAWEYHVFERLDGNSSLSELSDGLPPSGRTVGRRLNNWQQLGIAVQTDGGQYDKIASLDMLGMDLPELEENNE